VKRRAFTLIELMIVVALVALIAAVLVPNFLRARERARSRHLPSAPAEKARAVSPPASAGPLVHIELLRSQMRLRGWSSRMGMDVVNRYSLEVLCQFELSAEGGRELRVPFPRLSEEASNVAVEVETPQGRQTYRAWQVSPWGLVIQAPAGHCRMWVRYLAQGKDQMLLDLPPAPRRENLRLELSLEPGLQAVLAQSSLQPTSGSSSCWVWEFRNLVSDSPLVLELPVSHSLMGKVFTLCRLAGGAVFLFGLGFWYLGELYRPGQLSSFGWGHFLMLALNYCLFFPVLAVLSLSQELALSQALPATALVSLPLLSLHVWRSVDLRFALLYNLPLALATLAVVVGGVFVENFRDLLFVSAGVLAIAFATLTFPRWRQHRLDWQRRMELQLVQRVEEQWLQVEACGDPTPWVVPEDGSGLESARRRWRSARQLRMRARPLGQGQELLYSEVLAASRNVDTWLAEHLCWMEEHRPRPPASAVNRTEEQHCPHCGAQQSGHASYCSQCGSACARRLQCPCGAQGWFPALVPGWQHCPGCGS